jgi:hypothetical protein
MTDSLSKNIARLPPRIGRVPDGPLKLLYCGTIGRKQGLTQLCEAIHQSDLDCRFEIRGEGGEAATVEQWVKNTGDPRFQFGSLMPEDEFVRAIHDADWFVISETHGAGSSFLPSKLIPSISIRTPILAIADATGPLGSEMRTYGLGVHLEWTEVETMASRLRNYERNPAAYVELQRNCEKRAASYSRQPALDRMEELIALLIESKDNNRGCKKSLDTASLPSSC